jgi:hypothetical protein
MDSRKPSTGKLDTSKVDVKKGPKSRDSSKDSAKGKSKLSRSAQKDRNNRGKDKGKDSFLKKKDDELDPVDLARKTKKLAQRKENVD